MLAHKWSAEERAELNSWQSMTRQSGCAGLADRRNAAERALHLAREIACRAVTRAAYLAGAAGLDYSAPPGFPVDLTNVPKVLCKSPNSLNDGKGC